MSSDLEMLRHTVAALAYRSGKALRGAPAEFAEYRAGAGTRSAGDILAHMADLFYWARGLADGRQEWRSSPVLPWDEGVARYFEALEAFDRRLASDEALGHPAERLFQGPVADALTHTGQIAMLRRMAGCPIRGENYFKAEITAGRAGLDQAAPKVEFD